MTDQIKEQTAVIGRISPLAKRLNKDLTQDSKEPASVSDFAPDPEGDNSRTSFDHRNVRHLDAVEPPKAPKTNQQIRKVRKSQYIGKMHFRARPEDIELFVQLADEHGMKHGQAFKRMVGLLAKDLDAESDD